MIIEAGCDLHELLYPRLIRDHEANGGEGAPLSVAALDDELRYLFTRPAVTPVRLPLSDHAADIAACLDDDLWNVRYYVLAHYLKSRPDDQGFWLDDADRSVEECPELAAFDLLGQIAFDEAGYYSTLPRHSFRDYAGRQDLPRAAVIAGPHEYGCSCLACEQYADDIAELRRRARECEGGGVTGDDDPLRDGLDPLVRH